jgi:hypothetical protein
VEGGPLAQIGGVAAVLPARPQPVSPLARARTAGPEMLAPAGRLSRLQRVWQMVPGRPLAWMRGAWPVTADAGMPPPQVLSLCPVSPLRAELSAWEQRVLPATRQAVPAPRARLARPAGLQSVEALAWRRQASPAAPDAAGLPEGARLVGLLTAELVSLALWP